MQFIQNRIYNLRDERVMLNFDLATLYEVETKVLNQAVKRNIKRFPDDFMFRFLTSEWQLMRSHSVTLRKNDYPYQLLSQNKRKTSITPYAFTEQGVAIC